ncbi:transglycosylase SLT domain-containing protein [Actinomadura sp. ATCC 31491]|uniref:Transglycosylase SLT domain-containing protein n=1 Tax=Actinomadura luzonensis TaxID=2805427 RepID=A0ABT0G9M7_9ACTN|nr:transglycosylase SLT domain-containing protein [Actinomadura luzonensis]MCK2221299.1 transglycosylase SLT domain-containing protein [Actinomadura luzonensis]
MSVVSELAALRKKVDGDPQAVRDLAAGLRTAGGHAATSANGLVKSVAEVGNAWNGASADAFATYMAAYPKAGGDLRDALSACATALDTAAGKLQTAFDTVSTLHANATSAESDYKRDHQDAKQEDVDGYVKGRLGGDPVGTARKAVSDAEEALTAAKGALDKQLGNGFAFFKGIRQPGGADFQPGENKVDWQKVAGYSPTTLSSADPKTPPGLQNGGGGGGGGGGAGGGGAGAPSSYGNAPAPKAQVVDWIKEALTVIRSPEMAAVLRKRGLDVSDLDPNDPTDIQRIWTIIYHESGGNPNAINNWDVNAQNGVPSQGLMQTIPPTFNAHHLPGYDKIREPVDNIIAGVLYTYSRYGDLAHHPGIASLESGGGYKPY